MSENDDWIVAKLYVVERLTSALLGLWVSALPSDEEVAARIAAVRESAQAGVFHFPDDIRRQASALLAETLERVEQDIKRHRAAISAAPRAVQ
jgi:hypothetical protein